MRLWYVLILWPNNIDYDFDALKMFVSTTSTQIYSALGRTDYSITRSPSPDTLIAIPVML